MTDVKNPLVSILIPCFNAEQWIGEAIESALGQTWPEKEVIVVDDGSTDGSLAIIQEYTDRIKWETGPNRGGNPARNRLLKLARGNWVQYLDADDTLLPDKITHQVQGLQDHPDTDVLYSPSLIQTHDGDTVKREILSIPEPRDPFILLARWFLPQTGSPLWRKSAILDVGGWSADQPCCQEHELYLRLLKAGKKFRYHADAESVYRQWSEFTVCKKDQSRVHRERMKITDRLEAYLNEGGLMHTARQHAINQGRFETARSTWGYDRVRAGKLVEKIKRTEPRFTPEPPAAPPSYQCFFKIFGFSAAEHFAKIKRNLTGA